MEEQEENEAVRETSCFVEFSAALVVTDDLSHQRSINCVDLTRFPVARAALVIEFDEGW